MTDSTLPAADRLQNLCRRPFNAKKSKMLVKELQNLAKNDENPSPTVIRKLIFQTPYILDHLILIYSNAVQLDAITHSTCSNFIAHLSAKVDDAKCCLRLTKLINPYLAHFLRSADRRLIKACCVTLRNLSASAEKSKCRSMFIHFGCHVILMDLIIDEALSALSDSLLNDALIAFLGLIQHSDPNIDKITKDFLGFEKLIETLLRCVEKAEHFSNSVVKYSCWILFYLSSSANFHIEDGDLNILTKKLEHCLTLNNNDWRLDVIFPLLRTIGICFAENITKCSTSEGIVGRATSHEIVGRLASLGLVFLRCEHISLRKEYIWCMCNAISDEPTGESVIFEATFYEQLLLVMENSMSTEIIELGLFFTLTCARNNYLPKEMYERFLIVFDAVTLRLYLSNSVHQEYFNELKRLYFLNQ